MDEESLKEMLNVVTVHNVRNLNNALQWFVLDKNAFHCLRNKYLECARISHWSADCNDIKKAIIANIESFK
ncbi:hypothetical protein J6T66_00245 [bacterium]|nr:hypothetical protein [bacterium]